MAKLMDEDIRQFKKVVNPKFRPISKDDDASTTGRLVNTPAAIIPNPTGAGGQAGAQGLFGATLGAGTNDQRGRRNNDRYVHDPAPSAWQQIWDIYTNPQTYTRPFAPDVSTGNRRNRDVNPSVSGGYYDYGKGLVPPAAPVPSPRIQANQFTGMNAGAGAVAGSNIPNFIPSGTFLPSSFVPIPLQGFGATRPAPRELINNPGFNQPTPVIPIIMNYNNPQPQGSGMAGGTIGGSLSGDKQGQVNTAFRTPTTNGFTSTPNYPASYYMSPAAQNGQPPISTTGTTITRPTGTYDPANGQQWRDYWNQMAVLAAQNPSAYQSIVRAQALLEGRPDPFAPVVMSKEQIRQMKAEQRRRSIEKNGEENGDVTGNMGGSIPAVQSTSPFGGYTGDYYSTILNTGSG